MPDPMTTGKTLADYDVLVGQLRAMEKEQARLAIRELARTDLYFLLRYVLKRPDIENAWLLARCREVQACNSWFTASNAIGISV